MKKILLTLLLMAALIVPAMALNSPPNIPSLTGPTSGAVGKYLAYTTKTIDPDGNPVTYTFDWGDGSKLSISSPKASGSGVQMGHAWTTNGTKTVKAMAKDSLGAQSGWKSRAVTIGVITPPLPPVPPIPPVITNRAPAKPSIPDGDLAGYSGKPHGYVTKATDPDGDRVKITIDWGDGTSSTSGLIGSGVSTSLAHTWTNAPGTIVTFQVKAMATDEKGLVSAWSPSVPIIMLAERLQRPPAIPDKPVGPTTGVSGVPYTFSTSSTDPDGDKIKYLFDWEDGNTETAYLPSGQVATASHTWVVPAGKTWTYEVKALCSDNKTVMCPYPYWSEVLVIRISGPPLVTKTLDNVSPTE